MGEVEFQRRRQDGRGTQRVGDVGRAFEVERGQVRQVSERTAPTQNGERANEGVRPGRKHGQPSCELAGDALGAVTGDPARCLVVRFNALRDQGRHQRVQEQRVSAGRGVARVAETFGGRIEVATDQTRRRPGSQRRRPDRLAGGERANLADKFGVTGRIARSSSRRRQAHAIRPDAPRGGRGTASEAPSAHWQSSTMSSSGAREARFAVSQ